jgi:hypothetical protein
MKNFRAILFGGEADISGKGGGQGYSGEGGVIA